MASQHYMQKERHITCINSKNTISMEEKQGLPLVAYKSHFVSIAIKHNPRPLFSCVFSSSWITGMRAPRLALTLYIRENNQELILDYSSFPFSFSLEQENSRSLFLS